jgi:hypothetical protein
MFRFLVFLLNRSRGSLVHPLSQSTYDLGPRMVDNDLGQVR